MGIGLGGQGSHTARSGGRGHGGHGMPRGFVSKAQWRYFFANPKLRAKYAHKEAHKTPGGPVVRYRALPVKTSASKR
jgi:hypothetical protein